MPKSLTLESSFTPVRAIAQWGDWRLPWEVRGFDEDAEEAGRFGGVFDLSAWATLSITGPDARDYLHRMSTVNFKTFDGASVAPGGFLTGKAGVISLGWFLPAPGGFDYVVSPLRAKEAAAHLEAFHFLEKLTVTHSADHALFALWAPPAALGLPIPVQPLEFRRFSGEGGEGELWRDDCREALVWVRMKRDQALEWLEWLRAFGVSLVGHRFFEYHRIRATVVESGREVGEKDIVLEASAQRFVSRNKGCYPGQEVVERIFTYGQVNRKLLPVVWTGEPPAGDGPHSLAPEMEIVAWERDPGEPHRGVGLAYVRRSHWEFEGQWSKGGWQVRLRR